MGSRQRGFGSHTGAIDLETVLQRVPSWAETFLLLHSSVTGWYWKAGHQEQTQHLGNMLLQENLREDAAYASTGHFNSSFCLSMWVMINLCHLCSKGKKLPEEKKPSILNTSRPEASLSLALEVNKAKVVGSCPHQTGTWPLGLLECEYQFKYYT